MVVMPTCNGGDGRKALTHQLYLNWLEIHVQPGISSCVCKRTRPLFSQISPKTLTIGPSTADVNWIG
ncbi:hypothetical protein SLEP1_g20161 [Rubroshorea leprosula]|uniref:Uncharacterized protein n=1 Tax=Rubroshorea leprosula TaxID=152421 RepID=A0AAV5J530_9ROSI|nr:hypothetical protein SLEP1_g20161 [Rubroshorea leprosula]